jgi:hydroxylamine dehydrogenase
VAKVLEKIKAARVLIVGLLAVLFFGGIILMIMLIGSKGTPVEPIAVNALANSTDACVVCHAEQTTGIVEQFSFSTMASANVTCRDCHQVETGYPGSEDHYGDVILASPTSARCERCHRVEVAEFNQSRHGLPAYVAYYGSQDLSADLMAMYQSISEGQFSPDKSRNAIAAIEGPDVTPFTCQTCHDVGAPALDGSVGQCQKCHLRHTFSLEQVRKPETCNACHIGPDHPQWEIYQESPHGISYMTGGDTWNWEADPGTLTVNDFPAPTCAICHMSGFGPTSTTHDVGSRLTWYLFAPVSERRPDWETNLGQMQGVCLQCHNTTFVNEFYSSADVTTAHVNDWVNQSNVIIQPLKDNNLLTAAQFDESIDFTYFELWHHWGRTTKFGTWMQGPDYAQWHGAYELLSDLAELQEMVDEKMTAAGLGK